MEAYLNVVTVVVGVVFVVWVLRELVLSQKSKESVAPGELMCLCVQFELSGVVGTSYMNLYGDRLDVLQAHLNLISFSSIVTARVYYKGNVVYVMNKAGVLVAV